MPCRVLEMKMHVWKSLLWGRYTQACVHSLTHADTLQHAWMQRILGYFYGKDTIELIQVTHQEARSTVTPPHVGDTARMCGPLMTTHQPPPIFDRRSISNPHLAPHEAYDAQAKRDLGLIHSALCFYVLLYMLTVLVSLHCDPCACKYHCCHRYIVIQSLQNVIIDHNSFLGKTYPTLPLTGSVKQANQRKSMMRHDKKGKWDI